MFPYHAILPLFSLLISTLPPVAGQQLASNNKFANPFTSDPNLRNNALLNERRFSHNRAQNPFAQLPVTTPITDNAKPSTQTGARLGTQGRRHRDWRKIDWNTVDRRVDEGWWHLKQFGEIVNDVDMAQLPWNDQQIDLDFFLPFAGFRYNYTFIFPEGFVAFGYPKYIQPPYTFPNPSWPKGRDPSLIAAFMSEQTFMHVGQTRISHVWFRVISRPPNLVQLGGRSWRPRANSGSQSLNKSPARQSLNDIFGILPSTPARHYNGQLLKTQQGRVEDPEFLNEISNDIKEGMVGARGFMADYALVVTWERMAYGGSPKSTRLSDYERVKTWQNTYQMVLATDEIRTYCMFNYATINWTTSTSAGTLAGRGGKQSALVGFNGGNGTGFWNLPYSAEGNSYKLVQFGSTPAAGRWLTRIDEEIIYGGCRNDSTGILQTDTQYVSMLGGFALNITGPCFKPNKRILMQIDELTVNCFRINMAIARCVIPIYSIYRQGIVDCKISIDGGSNYPYFTWVYVLPPDRDRNLVGLIDDPVSTSNNWRNPMAEKLTVRWDAFNITTIRQKNVDIILYGYWEDVDGHSLTPIGYIGENVVNNGEYSFSPRALARNSALNQAMPEAWKFYNGGSVVVRVADDDYLTDFGDLTQWSSFIGFGFYWLEKYREELGEDWALDLCIEWFEYDGRRQNFIMDLEPENSCPCMVDQAIADFGRFVPLQDCDKDGDSYCYYQQGAAHCVLSSRAVWTGSAQVCCYGPEGYLSFSDDYEYNTEYLRFSAAGVPFRAHPWGMVYGEPHFITYDGLQYSFQGKGYYVLTKMNSPYHDMMVQIRAEQPPDTVWGQEVMATVITGLAAQDNSSALVEVYARKDFRRWRYKTDIYVDGRRLFFDMPYQKTFNFNGVNLRVPSRTFDQGIIEIMFETGLGIRVEESNGMLAIQVALPPSFNATRKAHNRNTDSIYSTDPIYLTNCDTMYQTQGLLGTFNGKIEDELLDPDCKPTTVSRSQNRSASQLATIYRNFGEKWRADGLRFPILFNTSHYVLYNPLSFTDRKTYLPNFSGVLNQTESEYAELAFTPNQVKSLCEGFESCRYDYTLTGSREVATQTMKYEKKYLAVKKAGEKNILSCGNLWKDVGVLKYPSFNNYLEGSVVTLDCKPEYFLHGEKQRTCRNGTWSAGWWAWCRSRNFEYFLKWLTGLSTVLVIALIIGSIFGCCYLRRKNYESRDPARGRLGFQPAYIHHLSQSEAPVPAVSKSTTLPRSFRSNQSLDQPSMDPYDGLYLESPGIPLHQNDSSAQLVNEPPGHIDASTLPRQQVAGRIGIESTF